MFEPLWSRNFIRSVQVIFSENFGTEGRGGYFDQYGIMDQYPNDTDWFECKITDERWAMNFLLKVNL